MSYCTIESLTQLINLVRKEGIPESCCLRKGEEERRGGRYGKAEQRVTLVVVSSLGGTNTVPALAATAIISHFSVILSCIKI